MFLSVRMFIGQSMRVASNNIMIVISTTHSNFVQNRMSKKHFVTLAVFLTFCEELLILKDMVVNIFEVHYKLDFSR